MCVANIFGQAVLRPLHRDSRLAPAARSLVCLLFRRSHGCGPFLDLAYAREILVELGPVAQAHPTAQVRGLLSHAVENALIALAAAVVKKAVEGQRRVNFHRHRRGRALPRDMRAVGHREVGLMVAGDRLLAAQNHAGLHRLLAQVPGQLLVDTDAPLELGPLLKRGPGEDVAGLARVDSHAGCVLVEQAGNDVDLGLERRQRLKARAELHRVAGTLGPPVRRVDTTAHEQRGEPLRARRGQVAGHCGGAPDWHRLEPWQGHRDAHASQERPT